MKKILTGFFPLLFLVILSVNTFGTTVTINLKDHTGALISSENGSAKYHNGSWQTIGTTSGGTITTDLSPGSYYFNMNFHNYTQQTGVITVTSGGPNIINFQTTLVTLNLKDHTGALITGESGTGGYYTAAWHDLGSTGTNGYNSIELLPGSGYYFNMNYNYYTQQQGSMSVGGVTQDIDFQTTLVKLNLKDHDGNLITAEDGTGGYYTAAWHTLGSTSGTGMNSIELLPGSGYYFNMDFHNKTQQFGSMSVNGGGGTQNINFQTTLVSQNIKDCNGNIINTSNGIAEYYVTNWVGFGTTSGGTVSKELLPGSYYFRMKYNNVTIQKGPISVSVGPTLNVDYQTTNITFPDASNASFLNTSTGTYVSFSPTDGIELFPGTFYFKINGSSTGVSKSISGCNQSFSTAPCTTPSIEVTSICGSSTLKAPTGNSYLWSPGGATTQSITVTSEGNYSVAVTYDFNCNGAANPSINYSTSVTLLPKFAITASAGSNGSISDAGSTNVCKGDNMTYTMYPDIDYHILDVLVDGSSVGSVSTYTFSNVTATHTISVTFEPDCTSPTITCPSNTTVNTTTETCKASVSFTATVTGSPSPVITYVFSGATTGSGTGTGSESTFNTGVTTVTLTATNGCRTKTCSFTITVVDTENPVAKCKAKSVTLVNGYATITENDINDESTDNCGIASISASKTSFDCSNIGDNTVTLTIVDIHGNTSTCDATVTVKGSIPTASITQGVQPPLCQGGLVVLTTTANETVTYLWSNSSYSEDASISVNSSGTYSVTVTNGNGCTASASTTVTYDATSFLSSYTIIATDEVELKDKSQVQTGGVGALGNNGEIDVEGNSKITGSTTFAKAKKIKVTGGSTVTTQYTSKLTLDLPDFKYNPNCDFECKSKNHNHCDSECKDKNHNHCKSDCKEESHHHCSHKNCKGKNDVTVGSNKSVTLTDDIFGKVAIGKGSTVTFTQPIIYMKELKTSEGVTIKFTEACVVIMVCDEVELKDDNTFNSTEKSVVLYVEDEFKAKKNSTINASIYSLEEIKVEANSNSITYMKGLFIAEKVKSNNAYWNWNTTCGSCENFNKKSSIATDEAGLINPNQISFNVYPNPNQGSFGIDIITNQTGQLKIAVIDLLGRTVYSETQVLNGPVFVPISLSNAANGQYVVRAEINGHFFTKYVLISKQ